LFQDLELANGLRQIRGHPSWRAYAVVSRTCAVLLYKSETEEAYCPNWLRE
jgi:hypothetical protein